MDEPLIFQATEKKVVVPDTKVVDSKESIEKRKQKFGSSIETQDESAQRKEKFSTESKEDVDKRKARFGSSEETVKEALEHKDKHELRKSSKREKKGKGGKPKGEKKPTGEKKPEKTTESTVAKQVVQAVLSEEEKKRQERFK
jgi:hypothetical protein